MPVAPAQTQWRLTLDDPIDFAVKPGFVRSQHCADFRIDKITPVNTFRDPQTGIAMLVPSFFSPEFHEDFQGLAQWTVKPGFWAEHLRAVDQNGNKAKVLGTILAANKDPTLIRLLISPAIVAVLSEQVGDEMLWAAQSTFTLGADASFVLHYHSLNDEMLRMHNWFCVQWGGIGIHFDSTGVIRAYTYPNGDNTQTPVLAEQFELANAGELHNKPGYFWFLPIPGIGLMIYHSLSGQFLGSQNSNASAGALRGHLVKLPSQFVAGVNTMLPASLVNIGLNPYLQHIIGYQDVTYPSTGTFTDAIFDPGLQPTGSASVATIQLPTAQQGVTATLLKADGSAAWDSTDASATGRQARVQITLTTTDPHYTPFAYGYQAGWAHVSQTRNTVPLVIGWQSSGAADRMMHLEFSEDEYLRFEGSVDLLIGSARGRHIIERGDATFLLEKSFDGGATWITHAGGLFSLNGDVEVESTQVPHGPSLFYYRVTGVLKDFWARVNEIHQSKQQVFDGLTIGAAINGVLELSGFSGVQNLPADATTRTIPRIHGGQQFQFAPRVGDSGEKLIQMFLVFLRRITDSTDSTPEIQVEYRLYYDWPTQAWLLAPKPQDRTNAWTLTPWSGEEHVAGNVIRFETLSFKVSPPEFNVLCLVGVTGSGPGETYRVLGTPLVNADSFFNTASVDYLGRAVIAEPQISSLVNEGAVAAMSARIYDAASHRRLQPKTTTPYWVDALGPLAYMTVRAADPTGVPGTLFGGVPGTGPSGVGANELWVKRRSLSIDQDGIQTMTLEMDSIWLGEMEIGG